MSLGIGIISKNHHTLSEILIKIKDWYVIPFTLLIVNTCPNVTKLCRLYKGIPTIESKYSDVKNKEIAIYTLRLLDIPNIIIASTWADIIQDIVYNKNIRNKDYYKEPWTTQLEKLEMLNSIQIAFSHNPPFEYDWRS